MPGKQRLRGERQHRAEKAHLHGGERADREHFDRALASGDAAVRATAGCALPNSVTCIDQ